MAVIRYLVWTVLLAALTRATTECLDDHHCTVGLNLGLMNPNETLGFLVPELCCREVQYPFTFLAHFFNISDYTVTFHLHEYYLLDVEVRTTTCPSCPCVLVGPCCLKFLSLRGAVMCPCRVTYDILMRRASTDRLLLVAAV